MKSSQSVEKKLLARVKLLTPLDLKTRRVFHASSREKGAGNLFGLTLQVDSILQIRLYQTLIKEAIEVQVHFKVLQGETMAETNRTEVHVYEQVVILSSCVLSFFGSLLIICTFARWPDLRTTPRKLLVYLSVTDLLSALSYFYGVLKSFKSDSGDCIAQGAISTFANTSSFFWTVSIAIYLYVFIVKSSQRQANNLVLYFHLISWGVPFAITVAALSLHKIGYDASEVSVGWCWVNIQAEDRVLWMLLTAKIWEFIAYVTLPVLYLLIKIHIHRAHTALSEYRPILTSSPVSQSPSSMADMKLTIIPIIFIVLRMWSTIRFLLLLTDSPAGHNPVLVTLHGIGNTFQGAANCIMFVLLTPSIRSRLVAQLCCRGQDKHWRSPSVSQNRASANTPSHREENTSPQTWENNEA